MLTSVTNHPLLVFALTFIVLFLAELLCSSLLRRRGELDDAAREHFGLVITAALTLLGLIIGFSFSMATSRYDQRKNLEEAEANAIGTEYVRADFLPAADAEQARGLLRAYLEERIRFYGAQTESEQQGLDARTAQLQDALWTAVRAPAEAKPTVLLGLVVSGMNDVLNSQGY